MLTPQQRLLKPRLDNYLESCKEITSDPEIVHVVWDVKSHFTLFLFSYTFQLQNRFRFNSPPSRCGVYLYGSVFLDPKKEGTYRRVIDQLNKFVENV